MDHAFMDDLEKRILTATAIPKTLIVCDSVGTAKSVMQDFREMTERVTMDLRDHGRQIVNKLGVLAFRKYVQKGEGVRYCGLTRKQRRKRIRIDRRHGRATTFLYAGNGFNKKVVFPTIRYPDPPTIRDFEFQKTGFPYDDLLDSVRGSMVMCGT